MYCEQEIDTERDGYVVVDRDKGKYYPPAVPIGGIAEGVAATGPVVTGI